MANNNNKQPKKQEMKPTITSKQAEKREPSQQEVMFFRIGMIVIMITLAIATIIMLITYFMDKENEVVPFENQMHVSQDDLIHFMIYDPTLGYVVDQDYFTKYDNYQTFRTLINNNDIIYVYFYRSSALNTSTESIIEAREFEGLAFFFLDLDYFPTIFSNTSLSHLSLDSSLNEMLMIYHTVEQTFNTLKTVNEIQETIIGIE